MYVFIHFKISEKFEYTHLKSSHPPEVKRGFLKGEAIQLLRTNSNESKFWTQITDFKNGSEKGYKETQIQQNQALKKYCLRTGF